jgi:hypothetical protein
MPNNSSPTTTITTQGGTATVPLGYGPGGTITASLTNFSAAVIAKNSTVGGVAGTYTSDANAIASQILSGLYAYVNGVKLTGTMPNQGSPTFTPTSSAQSMPAGCYTGGTVGAIPTASGTTTSSSGVLNAYYPNGSHISAYPVTVTGLSFTPSLVILNYGGGVETIAQNLADFSNSYPATPGRILTLNSIGTTSNGSASFYDQQLDGTNFYFTNGGFQLPTIDASTSIQWWARA